MFLLHLREKAVPALLVPLLPCSAEHRGSGGRFLQREMHWGPFPGCKPQRQLQVLVEGGGGRQGTADLPFLWPSKLPLAWLLCPPSPSATPLWAPPVLSSLLSPGPGEINAILPPSHQSKPEISRKTCEIRTFLPRPLQAAINPSAASQSDSAQPLRPQSGFRSCGSFLGGNFHSHFPPGGCWGLKHPRLDLWCQQDQQLPGCHQQLHEPELPHFCNRGEGRRGAPQGTPAQPSSAPRQPQ